TIGRKPPAFIKEKRALFRNPRKYGVMPILFRIEYAGVFNVHDRIAVELLPAQIDFDRRIEIILPEPRVGAADRHAGNTQPPVEIKGRKIFAIELLERTIGLADRSMFPGHP